MPQRKRLAAFAICFALILSVLVVYAQAAHFDFTNYDDPGYVVNNAAVRAGLTPAGVKWALTAVVLGNWTPLTMLSHMLDCELFGVKSGPHHLVNVLLHMLAALFLFASLVRATGALGRSAFVAFVFALHPLHVSSVAWIAERKDVLSACFFFLALWAYVYYAEKPSLARYLAVFTSFCLGLMSKPMLVTFPFVLLLFDIWPLRRKPGMMLLWEKLPLAALSGLAAVVTYRIQLSLGAVSSHPLISRIENAVISYLIYIGQMIWPARLSVFYPFQQPVATWLALLALAVIAAVSAVAVAMWRIRPYFATGWFWYLGTLVPVIGLVQTGSQSHADRYTYLPLVGLAMMLGWGAVEVAEKWPRTRFAFAVAAAAACAVYPALAWKEAAHWRNTETLFQHAIDTTGNNWLAHGSLGTYLMDLPGRRADAVEHLEAAVRIEPRYAEANNNLGICLLEAGLCDEAIRYFEASLRVKPEFQPLVNIGSCLSNSGHFADSIPYFEAAARARPNSVRINYNLGIALANIPGREVEAIAHFQISLRLKPGYTDAEAALGVLLAKLGRGEEALAYLEAAQAGRPEPQIEEIIEHLTGKAEPAKRSSRRGLGGALSASAK